MAIPPWKTLDHTRQAVALVILHGSIEPSVTNALLAGLPSCLELPVLQLDEVTTLHDDWATHGSRSHVATQLARLGSDCLLLAVEPEGANELEWLGSVTGQRLLHFHTGVQIAVEELIAELQQIRRERLLAVLPL
ncbi:hypothetical protein [Pseudomonas rhizoryzae]|uniref:hypothetical protein n=1 Tax=Pseudomonas rhizoryzae TaxID=2571129 RepID=UPI0007365154|nr:hypothetical protein [Pseudomonas rhizoryzae]KTT33976.1 hypothetical protein SB9_11755 [Pseudomonas psychrotolerans]KTT76541.1 hypothetical protein SB18R_11005 [Pseudomonas psychrotolerans]